MKTIDFLMSGSVYDLRQNKDKEALETDLACRELKCWNKILKYFQEISQSSFSAYHKIGQ